QKSKVETHNPWGPWQGPFAFARTGVVHDAELAGPAADEDRIQILWAIRKSRRRPQPDPGLGLDEVACLPDQVDVARGGQGRLRAEQVHQREPRVEQHANLRPPPRVYRLELEFGLLRLVGRC